MRGENKYTINICVSGTVHYLCTPNEKRGSSYGVEKVVLGCY